MKITANPPSFVEAVGAGSSNNGGEEYSRMFDSAVRDAAKDSSSKLRDEGYAMAHRNSERAAKAASDADADRAAARRHSSQNATSDRTDTVADSRAVANDDDAASETVETRQDRRAAIDALDQLLRGAFGAPTLAGVAKAGSTSAAMSDDETLAADAALKLGVAAVIPDAEGVASKAIVGAEKTRGKVSLEVVHMETHFEPRSDAFVLVEGEAEGAKLASEAVVTPDRKGLAATARDAASELLAANEARAAAAGLGKTAASADGKAIAAAATSRNTAPNDAGSTRETGPRLSFDEALARLSDSKGAESGSSGGGERQGRGALFAETGSSRTAKSNANANANVSPAPATASSSDDVKVTPFASMTSQVAGRVIDALGSSLASQRAPDLPPGEAYVKMTAGGAALKTLTIQLQPEALGRLDVSMRLVDGQLTLEIAATEAGTAKVLAEDREGLRKLLQHAGFSLDDTSITIVTREAGASSQARASTSDAGTQTGSRASSDQGSPAGGDASGDPGSNRDTSAGGNEGRQNQRRQSATETARAATKAVSTYL